MLKGPIKVWPASFSVNMIFNADQIKQRGIISLKGKLR